MAFFGRFDHSLDERGRVAIPARFREDLRGGWATGHPGGFLLMFPQAEWETLTAAYRYDLVAEDEQSDFLRRLYGASQEITWDSQGRILLMPPLRLHAGLESNVVFLGVNNLVEVHSEHSYQARSARLTSEQWESMRRKVAGAGLQDRPPVPQPASS